MERRTQLPVIQNEIGLTLDNILVATDFTPESEKALAYARALAHQFASRITLAHVVDVSAAASSDIAVAGLPLSEMRYDSTENMERKLNELGIEGITARGKTLESYNPAGAVVKLSEEMDADLVIVGTHSRHGLSKLILGSCSEEIVRSATCPVLVVGPQVTGEARDVALRNIVFATDLKHDAVEKAAVALAFAKESIAHVHILHVIEDHIEFLSNAFQQHARAEWTLSRLIPDSSYTWCSPEPSVAFGKIEQEILKIAESTQADLIVLGARPGIKHLNRIWNGIVEKVVAKANCPVLTICTS